VRHARIATALALSGAAALAAAPADAGVQRLKRKPQHKTVLVLDNYYSPAQLKVNFGSTIRWKWDEAAAEVHDVKLVKAPKGVKKFKSAPGGFGYVFKRRLNKAGTYRFICTFHVADGMRMTIVVRKRG
jgi:plastocyanin